MGTTSDKLTYLNTTKGKIKDVINMTGANITSDKIFRNYATKLYDGYVSVLKDKNTLLDNMPKGTSTGAITDAADLPVYEDKMSKESTQDGTPTPENPVEVKTVKGYRNLFDKDNANVLSVLVESDKLISRGSYRTLYIQIEPGKTYTISKILSDRFRVATTSTLPGVNVATSNFISSDSSKIITINTDLNSNYLCVSYYIATETLTEQEILDSIMIVEGTEELPYVPYGTNWIYKKIVGKNLFDKNAIIDNYALNRNNNTLIPGSNFATSDYCQVKPNTNYYLGLYYSSSSYGILFYDKDKKWLSSISPANTFETPSNTYFIRFSWNKNNFDANEIQLERGTTATTYESYKENIITLPLRDNEIAGIGNYKDELIVDKNGKCWLNKKTGKVVLDGSESGWQSQSFGTNSYSISISNMKPSINFNNDPIFVISNLFKGVKYDNRTTSGNNIIYSDTTNGAYIRNTTYTSLNDFKSMLQETNLITYYVLATPQLIDLNYTVDLTLFEGVNNISNSDDMDTVIKYIKDTYE